MDKRISRVSSNRASSILLIGNTEYSLIQEVGRGASSIAYTAKTADGRQYIIKEFYPYNTAERREDDTIVPCSGCEPAFNDWKQKFENAKKIHEAMSIQDQNFFLESENIPNSNGFVVMRTRNGVTLDKWRQMQTLSLENTAGIKEHIETCVSYICYLANNLDQVYHSNGYLHLDIKAENVFWFDKEKVLLRLFDFDSMQRIDELFDNIQNNSASIYTTKSCYGPEVRNINQCSAKTPEDLRAIDYYALGNLFYFLIYGCYVDEGEEDTVVEAYLDKYCALKQYLNDLFFARFFTGLDKRIHDPANLIQNFEHIRFFFSASQEKFLRPFNKAYLNTQFDLNMMPDLLYRDKRYQGTGTNYRLYQILQEVPGNLQIIGQGGSGKSTLLKYFAYLSATLFASWKLVCHYRELRRLDNDNELEDLIEDIQHSPANTIWLLDAFDEIENKRISDTLLDKLSHLESLASRIVISSRIRPESLGYPVVQMTPLTEQQQTKVLKRSTLEKMPFLVESGDFASTPLAIMMIQGIIQRHDGFQDFQEYLIGERLPNGNIKISSLGELVWNYLHVITMSSAKGSKLKMKAGWKLLHTILINSSEINRELFRNAASRQREHLYRQKRPDDNDPAANIGRETMDDLREFEELGFYSISNVAYGRLQDHMIVFTHKVFEDFFKALKRYYDIKSLCKDVKNTPVLPVEDQLSKILSVIWDKSVWNGNPYKLSPVTLQRESMPIFREPSISIRLCKDILQSTSEGRNMVSLLDILRNKFDEHPFQQNNIHYRKKTWYSDLVACILFYLYSYEDSAIIFRDLDLSNLELGEIPVYDNLQYIRSRQGLATLGNNETSQRKSMIFENVIFDGSMIWLKGYCWYQFKNCSFQNLNENSFIHPMLHIPGTNAHWSVGQDLYSINRAALMDCEETGDTKQEISIYPNTEYVDFEFVKHYTKRTRPICIFDGNVCFWGDANNSVIYSSVPFHLPDDFWYDNIICRPNTLCFMNDITEYCSLNCYGLDIRYAALWYCDKLNTLRLYTENATPDNCRPLFNADEPFSHCSNLKIIELDSVPVVPSVLFKDCPQIKAICTNLLYRRYMRSEYTIEPIIIDSIEDCKSIWFDETPQSTTLYPAIFVPRNLVQLYLNSFDWKDFFIYDEKRLSEIETKRFDPNDRRASEVFNWICERDGFDDPFYPRRKPK